MKINNNIKTLRCTRVFTTSIRYYVIYLLNFKLDKINKYNSPVNNINNVFCKFFFQALLRTATVADPERLNIEFVIIENPILGFPIQTRFPDNGFTSRI